MKTYKGFNKDFRCRGFQYEVGKEYEMSEDDIAVCEKGFHACESPLEVLDHYPIFDRKGDRNRFAQVEQSGKIDKEGGSTKVCSSKIHIKAELSLDSLIKAGVDWILNSVNGTAPREGGTEQLNDDSGYYAQIVSSGNSAQIGSSGNYAQIGSSGYSAQIGSSGDSAQIASSGNSAQIGSSGDSAQIVSSGEDSVICCAGVNCMVKAKQGSWVTLSEWEWDETKKRTVPVMVKTIRIDGKRYKEDTWYMLRNKKVVKVQEDER